MQVASLVYGIQRAEKDGRTAAQLILIQVVYSVVFEGLEDVALVEGRSDQVDEIIVDDVLG